jgi:hypothetical protein
MKKSKSLSCLERGRKISQLYKKSIFYGLVDKGGWFPQMLASRKTSAEYAKLAKISVLSVLSVAKNLFVSWCLSGWCKINQNEQIMQNEPNFRNGEMFLTPVTSTAYNEKCKLDTWSKRTQTNPIYYRLFLLGFVFFDRFWFFGFGFLCFGLFLA